MALPDVEVHRWTRKEYERAAYAGALIYARAGLRDYWISNLAQDVLEVYRDPFRGNYRTRLTLHRGERIASLACPKVSVAVDALLPKKV